MSNIPDQAAAKSLPLWLKLACTAWTAVLVVVYWMVYGPTNFLFFCDVALFFALFSMWTGKRLFMSAAAVGIVLPQLIWVADVAFEACGMHLLGMTSYMFNTETPLAPRLLSLFHGWLPFVLLYGVYRQGYDRRALWTWTGVAWALILISYMFIPPQPAPPGSHLPVNVNFVYGPGKEPQTWMNQDLWVAVYSGLMFLLIFLPTHLVLRWLWSPKAAVPAANENQMIGD
jgi:hypothetical protein